MKKIFKIIALIIVLCTIGVSIYFYINKETYVETLKVTTQNASQYFTEKGYVDYEKTVTVYPLVSGKVTEYLVKEGDNINSGDAICKIDTIDIDFQIQEANAQINSLIEQKNNLQLVKLKENDTIINQKNALQKQLDILDAQQTSTDLSKDEQLNLQDIIINQNKEDIERAKKDLEKIKTLFDQGVVSKTELELYEKALEKYEMQLEQSMGQLNLISSDTAQTSSKFYEASKEALNSQIKDLEQLLEKDYNSAMEKYFDAQIAVIKSNVDRLNNAKEKGVITATESGVVEKLPAKDQNIVLETMPVAIISIGNNRISAYIPTNDINSIVLGKEVDLILKRREGDEIYKGAISKIEDKAELKISSLGVEERKVKVEIEPLSEQELFKIGYDVDVKILAYEYKDVMLLPKTAVFQEDNIQKVWKIDNGLLVKSNVVEGIDFNNDVVIESGVSLGDLIVIDATLKELKEGLKVKITE